MRLARTTRGAQDLVGEAWRLWREDRAADARDVAMDAVSVWASAPDGVDDEEILALVDEVCGSHARAITETIRAAGGLAWAGAR